MQNTEKKHYSRRLFLIRVERRYILVLSTIKFKYVQIVLSDTQACLAFGVSLCSVRWQSVYYTNRFCLKLESIYAFTSIEDADVAFLAYIEKADTL